MCIPKLQGQIAHLKPLFSKIFRENSIKMRIDFFSDELIRCLWTQYIFDENHEIKTYMRRLRDSDPYQG